MSAAVHRTRAELNLGAELIDVLLGAIRVARLIDARAKILATSVDGSHESTVSADAPGDVESFCLGAQSLSALLLRRLEALAPPLRAADQPAARPRPRDLLR